MCNKRITMCLFAILVAISSVFLGAPCTAQTDDAVTAVVKGCQDAVDSIQTYKGSISEHYWRRHASGDIVEMAFDSTIAFAHGKYKISQEAKGIRNDLVAKLGKVFIGDKPGIKIIAFDGTNYINTVLCNKCIQICSTADNSLITRLDSSLKERIDIVGHGISKIEAGEFGKLRIIGRERLGDNECIIVEKKIEIPMANCGMSVTTYEYWVNPMKGYTIPKVRCWVEATGTMNRSLWQDINTEMKDYGQGIWGPSKSTLTQYELYGADKGKENLRMEVTYGPDFQINVPVSSKDVTLELAPGA